MTRHPTTSAAEMQGVVNEVQSLLKEVGNGASGTVHEFKRRVGHALDAARHRLDLLDDTVRTGARQAATVTDDYAHAHPWQVLAAGALVGLAIGVMLSRR